MRRQVRDGGILEDVRLSTLPVLAPNLSSFTDKERQKSLSVRLTKKNSEADGAVMQGAHNVLGYALPDRGKSLLR